MSPAPGPVDVAHREIGVPENAVFWFRFAEVTLRDLEITIQDGITRRQYRVSLTELGAKYRKGVGRARVCQIERMIAPWRGIRRDYAQALRTCIAARRRRDRRLGF
jgi:hypothetical protein